LKPKIAQLVDDLPTLAERLAAQGFATGAVTNNPFLSSEFGLQRGFANYDYAHADHIILRRADKVVDKALRWLNARDQGPTFLLVHIYDPHAAYDPPPSFQRRFTHGYDSKLDYPVAAGAGIRWGVQKTTEQDRAFIIAAHDEELAYVDTQVGRLLRGLESRGRLKDTLVIFTSDHGEELFDHDKFEHGHSVYQELLHVPLLVWGPGVRAQRVRGVVSHVDVVPTILDALGLSPWPELPGLSLWPVLRGASAPGNRAILSEVTLYGDEWKSLLRWPWKVAVTDGAEAPRLFHLERDPGEHNNLANAERERLAAMAEEALALAQESERARGQIQAAELAPDLRARLKALGYIE
jgi:arylsulfatase A-like enzyme